MEVTERDLIRALEQASLSYDDDIIGFTTKEIIAASGMTNYRVRITINRLVDSGIMEFAGKRRARNIIGDACRKPVYKFIDGLDIPAVLELLESDDVDGIQALITRTRDGND